jgi:squalene-hopene/tetraprenyl-beta-curcumene cyclase
VATLRPVRPLPFGIAELRSGVPKPPMASPLSWDGAFARLDRVLHRYARHASRRRPAAALRKLAMRRAAEWILARQEADGGWGGIQPPWVYSLLALHLLGYSLDSPAVRAGLAGLDGFTIREQTPQGVVRRLEACQSPVWDTALALTALLDAGVPGDNASVRNGVDWLLGEEIDRRGDWAVRRPQLAPGGWAFEFANDVYPDIDDTAEIVLALRRVAHPDEARVSGAAERGIDWTVGMQSADGGWGAFDADNTGRLPTKLPFCDFGEVIDPPSADVTAHVVEMLAHTGRTGTEALRRGVRWLLDAQEADGSWFGRWGVNYIYGTWQVLAGLAAIGVPLDDPMIAAGANWLVSHQQPSGAWGESADSYDQRHLRGQGPATASQTAWAVLGLVAAGWHDHHAAARGVRYLLSQQLTDGTWNEPEFTGTGFPRVFYLRYHLYRIYFPLLALSRFAVAVGADPDALEPAVVSMVERRT